MANIASAQMFYGPSAYLLMNVSSENCKYYVTSTRSYSAMDIVKGEIEIKVRYEGNLESKNDTMLTSFKKDFIHADSFKVLTIKAQILDYDKIKKDVESTSTVKLKGSLDINGVTKDIEFEGKLHYRPSLIGLEYVFYINNKDFNLVAPGKLKDCISPVMQLKGNTHMYDLAQK